LKEFAIEIAWPKPSPTHPMILEHYPRLSTQ
jgi:hypothetical protein